MDRLWTPWRSEYVTKADDDEGCFLCDPDEEHVLHRSGHVFVILNLFPYNTGHLMVAPVRHVGELWDLTQEERHDLFDTTVRAVEAVRDALSPHGFNTGMNLGRVAGAGVPGHLHVHVVPRWGGDTNFMPVTGGTKVLPETLDQTAAKLRPLFDAD